MIAVAGVSGHVGSVVAEELLKRGQKVKVLVRDAQKGLGWSKRGAEVGVADLDDEPALTAALRGTERLFVLLPPNFAAPDFYGWQRATGEKIARAVKAAGLKHVALLSSVGADLDRDNGPIKGLHHFENSLRATGVALTALRAGFFQENVGNSLGAAKQAGIYPNFGEVSSYPFPMIATVDIGRAAADALVGPVKSEIVDIIGPAYTIDAVAEKLAAALKKPVKVQNIPEAGWVQALTGAGLPLQFAESYAEMYRGFGTGKIQPKGDRTVHGTTALDDTIARLVG